MFLNKLINSNPQFVKTVLMLYKKQIIPINSFIIDFDTLMENAQKILKKAESRHLELFYMAKQFGRIPHICQELEKIGYKGAVVVDHQGFEHLHKHNLKICNTGHLSQVPNYLLDQVVQYSEFITVFSLDKIYAIDKIAKTYQKKVKLLIRVVDSEKDIIYAGQTGGFELKDLSSVLLKVKDLSNVKIIGVTSFPCFLYDSISKMEAPTQNLKTLKEAQKIMLEHGYKNVILNLPSSTCTETIDCIADAGGSQGEPGHALTGTIRSGMNENSLEQIAMLYLTEISHTFDNNSFCFGGGYYPRGGLQNALIGANFESTKKTIVKEFDASAIDYYLELEGIYKIADPVIMCFRTQVFKTRSKVVVVKGIKTNSPQIEGIYNSWGEKINEN